MLSAGEYISLCLFLSESSLPSTPRGPVASPQDARMPMVASDTAVCPMPQCYWLCVAVSTASPTHRGRTTSLFPLLSHSLALPFASSSAVLRASSCHSHTVPCLPPGPLQGHMLSLFSPCAHSSTKDGQPSLATSFPCDSECLP